MNPPKRSGDREARQKSWVPATLGYGKSWIGVSPA